ncbi:MAG: cysteine desulfurase [Bacillota bacterium]|nr:MAG: cysteine desulfurase [Bacillota bacterium]
MYLDSAATSRPFVEVAEAVREIMERSYGNPSSRHTLGLGAAAAVRRSREILARVIGADPTEIVFTGGGSEANNLALKGVAWAHVRSGKHVVLSAVEHPSVIEAARWLESFLGFELSLVNPDRDGAVRPEAIEAAVRPDTVLVSLMHVNNEVGTVQPVGEVGRRLLGLKGTDGRRKGLPLFHVDAVQSLGRMAVDVRAMGADLLTVSGHKVHGPKGVGALYVARGVRLVPLVHGGGHEAGRRSGTENVPGIVGFGEALSGLLDHGPDEVGRRLSELKDLLLATVRARCAGVVVNGDGDTTAARPRSAPHILNLSFPGIPGEVLQHHLERSGVYVSTGSACSSHHRGRRSHVLQAMGLPEDVVDSAVRLSFSVLNTPAEAEEAGLRIAAAVEELSERGGRG